MEASQPVQVLRHSCSGATAGGTLCGEPPRTLYGLGAPQWEQWLRDEATDDEANTPPKRGPILSNSYVSSAASSQGSSPQFGQMSPARGHSRSSSVSQLHGSRLARPAVVAPPVIHSTEPSMEALPTRPSTPVAADGLRRVLADANQLNSGDAAAIDRRLVEIRHKPSFRADRDLMDGVPPPVVYVRSNSPRTPPLEGGGLVGPRIENPQSNKERRAAGGSRIGAT